MIIKPASLLLYVFLYACNNIDFILTDYDNPNPIKDKVRIVVQDNEQGLLLKELVSFLGKNEKHEYILEANLYEEKKIEALNKTKLLKK